MVAKFIVCLAAPPGVVITSSDPETALAGKPIITEVDDFSV